MNIYGEVNSGISTRRGPQSKKCLFSFIWPAVCVSCCYAGVGVWFTPPYSPPPEPPAVVLARQREQARLRQKSLENWRERIEAASVQSQRTFIPADPYRVIWGRDDFARGDHWVQFWGTITKVETNGVWMTGAYRQPCNLLGFTPESYAGDFFVRNFPYCAGKKDRIRERQNFVAYREDVALLNYETIGELPPSLVDAFDQTLSEQEEMDLKILQARANGGDPSAQYKLAVRYLNGDGIKMSHALAVQWLKKSAAQGSVDASNTLARVLSQ